MRKAKMGIHIQYWLCPLSLKIKSSPLDPTSLVAVRHFLQKEQRPVEPKKNQMNVAKVVVNMMELMKKKKRENNIYIFF